MRVSSRANFRVKSSRRYSFVLPDWSAVRFNYLALRRARLTPLRG